ncbi:ABC transporter ATP-binding protein [Catenulispora sp. NF23]|uniref:ABC transporter ATP-binding protein n=1 Tax=Catenulispora pinistramenti TaxID=2705254 RepID=UPI001BA7BBEB|nr:ABC transporter ATP-binding protein [Catenulispora pinistramenti]MBS2534189.1 ABC transporter ATP-binding protein [Catenulispora pinistramenti]
MALSPTPPAAPTTSAGREALPVATYPEVRRYAGQIARKRRRDLVLTIGLFALAALAGLFGPRLLGSLIDGVQHGTTSGHVDTIVGLIAFFLVLQTVLTRYARLAAGKFGEGVLAELRENFVSRVLELPLSVVERAGSGDLLSRSSRDVDSLSMAARYGLPTTLVAIVTVLLTIGALALVSPWAVLPLLVIVPPIAAVFRWYLKRAPAGYLAESARYADMTDGLAETVDGARTVEALGRQRQRIERTDDDIRAQFAAEHYTLRLRCGFWPTAESCYIVPVALTLLFGGLGYIHGWFSLGQVTAATLYMQQIMGPIDDMLAWADQLQVGGASLARLLGVAGVPADREASGEQPDGEDMLARDVRYSYIPGREVLHGVDLTLHAGERLAMVGPSGAGKSTLGRLLAGIHGPSAGSVAVGGVPLVELPLADLRGQVALVNQEHHVFAGTVRENVVLPRPESTEAEVRDALAAVDALAWVEALPEGLQTAIGAEGHTLSPAQAQQLALARLVLADPHTLVLDEATSLIDPRAARHLERSLAAVLEGRTVIAIAHRLHTAHDADRVAVVEDGMIAELGSHEELVATGGAYAGLWESWHGRGSAGE